MGSTPGFEPGPRWWEASALTTAPFLAAQQSFIVVDKTPTQSEVKERRLLGLMLWVKGFEKVLKSLIGC